VSTKFRCRLAMYTGHRGTVVRPSALEMEVHPSEQLILLMLSGSVALAAAARSGYDGASRWLPLAFHVLRKEARSMGI
jgi:hypothetical protein